MLNPAGPQNASGHNWAKSKNNSATFRNRNYVFYPLQICILQLSGNGVKEAVPGEEHSGTLQSPPEGYFDGVGQPNRRPKGLTSAMLATTMHADFV
jgi:hypothetical protein